MYTSEIYLNKANINREEWLELIKSISKYNGLLKKWSIIIKVQNHKISYYLKTKFQLPSSFLHNSSFLFKTIEDFNIEDHCLTIPTILPLEYNIIDYLNYCHIKKIGDIKYITINISKIADDKLISKIHIYFTEKNQLIKSRVFFCLPSTLLSVDFQKNNTFSYQKTPKYLDISKIYHILKTDSHNSTLKIDTFPYLDGNFYLDNSTIDFNRHSLIIGSSGSGKSKFISSFIKTIHDTYPNQYKIVMIDPHASIENDIGSIANIINFQTLEDSINLFSSISNDIIVVTELTLELFKNLISDQYNSKLERVLRHSIYLLLAVKNFNFTSLKNILVDPLYRTDMINAVKNSVPPSVIHFFLNDFNDLKTKSYGEAISPIISFIDEMSMVPVFNAENIENTLTSSLKSSFLTLFSLDKTVLGDKVTKTIAGFIMQQLLILIQTNQIKEHIIFIIDEVPVIENDILSRFLSEARKYNLSLILASQYFNQISPTLKEAIFANTINYYIFRVSRTDASLLVNHLDIKIPNISNKSISEQQEEKVNLLTTLNNRNCLVRISSNNVLTPAFKAQTLDFKPIPAQRTKKVPQNLITTPKENNEKIDFKISNTNLHDILRQTSSSRMVVK